MQLHLQDIAKVVLFRNRAKPAQVRIAFDDVENIALKLLDESREPLETMASLLKKHQVPKESFALYANLENLTDRPKGELQIEDIDSYNTARQQAESIIYGTGVPPQVSQRTLELFERQYLH